MTTPEKVTVVPSVPTVPPLSTSTQKPNYGIKLEVAEQSEQSEQKSNPTPKLNEQQSILVQRLKEMELSVNRFLKVGYENCPIDKDKAAFEKEWEKHLYGPNDLSSFPRWGVCGKEYLVLIDSDDIRMYEALSKVLPPTFEVTSPRRGLPHKYYCVPGKSNFEVQNGHLHIDGILGEDGKPKSLGEVRAQNNYLVAPGTTIRYLDKDGKETTGMYTITKNLPITRVEYDEFMKAIEPFFGSTPKQRLTKDHIENGIPEGQRATVLFQEACSLASFQKDGEYLTRQFILDAITVSAFRCTPPFDNHEELERMVDNAISYRSDWEKKKQEQQTGKKFIEKIAVNQQSQQQQEQINVTDLNPILIAKRIEQTYNFALEKDTELLYVYDEKEGIFTQETEAVIKTEMCRLLDNYTKVRFYSDIENWIKYNDNTPKVTFNPDPDIIAVKNGVLDLKTRTLKDFSPSYYLTNKIPHNFNPEKRNGKIEKFIGEIMSEKHKLQHQEFMGKTIYRKAIHQVAPVLNGEGNNGKSVLIDVDTFLLGRNNVSNVTFQALTYDKFASADLKDKIANFCADMPAESLKHLGTVKMIITSDTITSQKKHKDPFNWTPIISMMFSCNHAPEIDVTEDNIGTFRRFMMWEFPFVFSPDSKEHTEDKHLRDKLLTEEEAEAYLNYCLDGLDRLLKQGDYTSRDSVQETRKAYIKKSNGCQAFTDEAIEVTNAPEDWFFTDTAYRLYANYCQREKMPTMPKAKLSKAIEQFCNGAERFKRRPLGENQVSFRTYTSQGIHSSTVSSTKSSSCLKAFLYNGI